SELGKIAGIQFAIHENINIYGTKYKLHFSKETKVQLIRLRNDLCTLSSIQKNRLCENCKIMFMQRFYGVNQYIYFSKVHESMIVQIYKRLLHDLENLSLGFEIIEHSHYERIKKFIAITNSSVYQLNVKGDDKAKGFVCKEYSVEFLLDLFDLDLNNLMEPILDIGCGKYGSLVCYLQASGLQAFGFDRNASGKNIVAMDWMTYDYGENTWGCIISNLSFSSHFLYHHLRNDDISNLYAMAYMDILSSLKKNGKWIYAPSIDFFEDLLPRDLYLIEREKIHEDFSKTTIVKLY
ncbi:MAG: class I SAM-dependent methyltransferase, partial [Oscillospiraceae bacterium]